MLALVSMRVWRISPGCGKIRQISANIEQISWIQLAAINILPDRCAGFARKMGNVTDPIPVNAFSCHSVMLSEVWHNKQGSPANALVATCYHLRATISSIHAASKPNDVHHRNPRKPRRHARPRSRGSPALRARA